VQGRNLGTVLVVGAGLAGARCAETLRAEGFEGRVLVLGEEREPPYERPALSKEVLAGQRDARSLALRPTEFWDEARIELLLGTRVERIRIDAHMVQTSDGRDFAWDALVLATGAGARPLSQTESRPPSVRYLRTVEDAVGLAQELVPGTRLAVVGSGFIGAEVASSARARGVEVVLLGRGRTPFERLLGRDVGGLLAERYRGSGVEIRTGCEAAGVRCRANGRAQAVVLADGANVACDAVLIGVGTALAAGALVPALAATDGSIETDASGRTAVPGVYACGDVASWWRPSLGRRLRFEHWTSAAGQGAAVARAIIGDERPFDEPPYFWSDQFGLRLQHVGAAESWARVEVEQEGESFVARYLDREGCLLAGLAVNRPREVAALRREVAAGSALAA
jgi:3-phenylpropionate/trans-cinnamate dioxygenase ferredoxin reductase component